MTVTADNNTASANNSAAATGRVVRTTGPVVDVEFPRSSFPTLNLPLHVDIVFSYLAKNVSLECSQHLGENQVRTISMQPTDGLVRAVPVTDPGGAISVPVGPEIKAHVSNALGDCLDQ